MDMGLYLSPWDIHDDSYGYKDKDGKALVEEVTENGHKVNRPIDGHDWNWVYENDAEDYNKYYQSQLERVWKLKIVQNMCFYPLFMIE